MDRVCKGMFAISKAGHDFRKLYMIVDFDEEYVYLCDGKLRKTDNPKKKKYKHIQVVKMVPEEIGKAFEEGTGPDDIQIRKAIHAFGDRFV